MFLPPFTFVTDIHDCYTASFCIATASLVL